MRGPLESSSAARGASELCAPRPPPNVQSNASAFVYYMSSKAGSRLERTQGAVVSQRGDNARLITINPSTRYQTVKGFGAPAPAHQF